VDFEVHNNLDNRNMFFEVEYKQRDYIKNVSIFIAESGRVRDFKFYTNNSDLAKCTSGDVGLWDISEANFMKSIPYILPVF